MPFPCTTWNKAFLKGPGQRWLAIYLLNIYIYIYIFVWNTCLWCLLWLAPLKSDTSSIYLKMVMLELQCCRYLQYLQHSYQGVFTCLVQQTNPRQTPAWQFCKRALFWGWLSDLQLGNRKVTNWITLWISVNLNGSEIRKNMQECLHQFFIAKFTHVLFCHICHSFFLLFQNLKKKHKQPVFYTEIPGATKTTGPQ